MIRILESFFEIGGDFFLRNIFALINKLMVHAASIDNSGIKKGRPKAAFFI